MIACGKSIDYAKEWVCSRPLYHEGLCSVMTLKRMDVVSTYPAELKTNPSRPEEASDFARVAFRTDHRVLKHVKEKWEVRLDEHGNPEDPGAWRRAMEACYELGKAGHAPEKEWYEEAQALAERVGKRWDETPIPTLVEALARKEGQWPLGFPTTKIPADAHVRICTQPMIPFRGRRLVLGTASIASRLLVVDIRVGNNSYCCNSCPIPGSVFSDRAFPMWLKLPTAQVSQTVQLLLHNVSGVELTVNAMLHGDVIEPEPYAVNINSFYGKRVVSGLGNVYRTKPGEKVVYEDSDSVVVESGGGFQQTFVKNKEHR
jgi:hypothetical protein